MDLANASIGQLMIPVEDLDQGVAFYRDTLGLPFLFMAPPQMAFFICGAVRLLVGVLPPGQPRARASAIYFRVDDIEAVAAALVAKGVVFAAPPHIVHRTASTALWLANFNDPDGNPLALMCELPLAAAA
ncbi:VOC family protein [Paucibacter sp. APW11]|uniref:VOC family protein n=1 Tax=Roseateles aquae TaxID=3077235 RepID=A0ABU3PEZ8_9BURK|nr:VOC family protein [Paucibacter sp. APW11]MDT9001088.1 VOC family protein [Paucibacter sp. APW11]